MEIDDIFHVDFTNDDFLNELDGSAFSPFRVTPPFTRKIADDQADGFVPLDWLTPAESFALRNEDLAHGSNPHLTTNSSLPDTSSMPISTFSQPASANIIHNQMPDHYPGINIAISGSTFDELSFDDFIHLDTNDMPTEPNHEAALAFEPHGEACRSSQESPILDFVSLFSQPLHFRS
jgi:hypothetical protein